MFCFIGFVYYLFTFPQLSSLVSIPSSNQIFIDPMVGILYTFWKLYPQCLEKSHFID